MTVEKLLEVLTEVNKLGLGKMQLKVQVPCVCIDDDNEIIENEYRTKNVPINLSVKDFVKEQKKGNKSLTIAKGYTECSYDEYIEDDMEYTIPG